MDLFRTPTTRFLLSSIRARREYSHLLDSLRSRKGRSMLFLFLRDVWPIQVTKSEILSKMETNRTCDISERADAW